jgi:EmrB/QacA subfamily drug resistance transporter
MSASRISPAWTFAIVSIALFMVVLDNLVVTTALPSIRADLGGGLQALEWTINAYTLAFAVLLPTGAALGDRFGRRRMFVIGLGIFTASSALAALSPDTGTLIAARALQGAGAAIVAPLTLTLLSTAFPPERRGLALGAWSGISGLGVALGPLVGGAVVDGISWHWIFWLNVPIGIALTPLAYRKLAESYGPEDRLDIPGVVLAGIGLLGLVYGFVEATDGWTSTTVLASLAVGVVGLIAFVAWELRAPAPMLPMRFFRSRAFSAANAVSLVMYFGVFGSIFLLAQYFQVVQGHSPLEAGLRTLPWTIMPMFVAPIAGLLSDRIGSRPLMVAGLALQAIAIAWLAAITTPTANAVLSAVRPQEAGQASGATNAIREVGGALGVAVLASVFASNGSYASPQAYTDGMTAAIWVGAAILAAGALVALLVPGKIRAPRDGAAQVSVAAA